MADLRMRGRTQDQMAAFMNGTGTKTGHGKAWSKYAVARVLVNYDAMRSA